jgi:hypothetical protein
MSAATIALLNDLARVTLSDCRVIITPGIAALNDLDAIMAKVQAFDKFNERNDPYGEHDFGVIQYGENMLFWKIDTYDLDLCMHSPDPADPTVTARVLTVMLAEEY